MENAVFSASEKQIMSYIRKGERRAVHLCDLSEKANMNERFVQKTVERIRRKGVVIVSNNHGYFFPETPAEISRFVECEEKRARSIFFTLRAARKLKKEMEGSDRGTGAK